jgi:hypothetical protein
VNVNGMINVDVNNLKHIFPEARTKDAAEGIDKVINLSEE